MQRVPVHPGEILLHEFLEPLELSQYRLAQAIQVPQTRIAAIIKGERSITADTALRLGRFFGVDSKLWMNLQQSYDLALAERQMGDLKHLVPRTVAEL